MAKGGIAGDPENQSESLIDETRKETFQSLESELNKRGITSQNIPLTKTYKRIGDSILEISLDNGHKVGVFVSGLESRSGADTSSIAVYLNELKNSIDQLAREFPEYLGFIQIGEYSELGTIGNLPGFNTAIGTVKNENLLSTVAIAGNYTLASFGNLLIRATRLRKDLLQIVNDRDVSVKKTLDVITEVNKKNLES